MPTNLKSHCIWCFYGIITIIDYVLGTLSTVINDLLHPLLKRKSSKAFGLQTMQRSKLLDTLTGLVPLFEVDVGDALF